MKIKASSLPLDLLRHIKNPDPLEGEDIIIEDDDGGIVGAIIQPKAYQFFVTKIEEKENEIDSKPGESFDRNSKMLDDLIEDSKND